MDAKIERRELFKIDAVPAKEILKNKARVCPPLPAICEILDNIFDNYEEAGGRGSLEIEIESLGKSPNGQIVITENSGGVARKKLEPLVKLGVGYHGAKGSIGVWGEGFKVAAFSLGEDVEVTTHFPTERPVAVHFAAGWLDSADWAVPVYSVSPSSVGAGSTVFRIRHLTRDVQWTEIMREVAVIYGHKLRDIEDSGNRVKVTFNIDGSVTSIRPRPLASPEMLRQKLAYPPDFSPLSVTSEWDAEHGRVSCLLIVGLTPRHSGETSGVYMYGNGRLFARHLRTRAVGYGESGNSILRDHPMCWRIHAYAFFTADNGADIPWQAPLKDGVSENHTITAKFREFFKSVVAPYSSFAKVAKAADLVPYTDEWSKMEEEEKVTTLFGSKTDQNVNLYKSLPKTIREFRPPTAIPGFDSSLSSFDHKIEDMEDQAKYARTVIQRRNGMAPQFEITALRSLNPGAFKDLPQPRGQSAEIIRNTHSVPRTTKVSLELTNHQLVKLKELLGCFDDKQAVARAVAFTVRHYQDIKSKQRGK